jgi:hypothetical protein
MNWIGFAKQIYSTGVAVATDNAAEKSITKKSSQ